MKFNKTTFQFSILLFLVLLHSFAKSTFNGNEQVEFIRSQFPDEFLFGTAAGNRSVNIKASRSSRPNDSSKYWSSQSTATASAAERAAQRQWRHQIAEVAKSASSRKMKQQRKLWRTPWLAWWSCSSGWWGESTATRAVKGNLVNLVYGHFSNFSVGQLGNVSRGYVGKFQF